MKYCCNKFKFAVADGLISKPGDRVPMSKSFSDKYFIKKIKEPYIHSGVWFYMYVEHCPSCGEKIG